MTHRPVTRKPLKVVFLDRDGVINHDSPAYIRSWSEVRFIPGSLSAVKMLNDAGFTVIIVTNQSAVRRGLISLDELARIHRNMASAVAAAGGCITDVFFCPHLPDEGCPCRKPLPGLIRRAQEKYLIDLEKSYMIGDRTTDIECARRAGCGGAILVGTGNSGEAPGADGEFPPDMTVENLAEAARWIIRNASRK